MKNHVEIVSGGEMISRAAFDAGVNFFAGYPITPVNTVYTSLIKKLQTPGKVAIGVSDEISAISLCIGASIGGAMAMTATSAPGFLLMTENLGLAFMTETPLLIILGQRLGPSTGAATINAEGDILLAAHAISGGYNVPVLSPNSIFSCYETTIKAIEISEKYRTPVILLTEKDILMSYCSINPNNLPKCKEIKRELFNGKDYVPYHFSSISDVPSFVAAGAGSHRVVATGSLHNKKGLLSSDSSESIKGCETVIIPEENKGNQYSSLILPLLGEKIVKSVNSIGKRISPDMIFKKIME